MNQSLKTFLIVGFACITAMILLFGLGNALLPLFIAFVQAYLSFPVIRALEKRGIKRVYAVIAVFISVAGIISLIVVLMLPSLIKDLRMFIQELPHNSAGAIEKIELLAKNFGYELDISKQGLKEFVSEHASGDFVKSTSGFLKGFFSNFMGVLLFVLNLLLIPIFFFHLINQYELISKQTYDLVPLPWRARVSHYTRLSNTILSGYIRGQMLVVMILAILYGTGFSLIGLRFGFLIGVVTGILSIIPFVGSIFGFTVAMIIALANFTGLKLIIGVVVVFAVIQALEGLVITPKLVGGKVGLGILPTMLVLIIGGNLFGLAGMIVAIPVGAIVKTIMHDIRDEYKSLKFYNGA